MGTWEEEEEEGGGACLGGKSTQHRNGQGWGQAGAQAASTLTLEPQASVCRPQQGRDRETAARKGRQRALPGAVLVTSDTTRPEPRGVRGGCLTGEGWSGLPHTGRAAAVYPTGLVAPAARRLLASAAGSFELSAVASVNHPCCIWPSFRLNIKAPFSPHSHFCLFVVVVAKLYSKKLI